MEDKGGKRKCKMMMEYDHASSTTITSSSDDDDDGVDCSGGGRYHFKRKMKLRKGHDDHGDFEREKEVKMGGDLQDPLVVFGSYVMLKILSGLDAHSMATCLLVSRGWQAVASDDAIWSLKCDELWLGNAHIPRISKVHGLPKLAAYSLSVKDGKRTRITREDLCDHSWEFHFTEVVSDYWLNLDPFWTGIGPPMRRHFHPDGSHSADPGDRVWGGHECCYSVITSFLADGRIREHYVRINRWPPMSVSRKLDWSWEMCNKIHVYSSIPDPEKVEGTGPLYPTY